MSRARSAAKDEGWRRPVGRPPGPGGETRPRVLKAAARLFAERGYHGTGVADIGRAAGIQRGALYYHIGSKEDLLYDVLSAHVEESLAGEERIANSNLPPDEKLNLLLHHHISTAIARHDEARIYLRDAGVLTGERAAHLHSLQARVKDVWTRVLDEGVAAGAFRPVDHIILIGLLSLANMVFLWYRPDGSLTPEQVADRYSALLLDGLRAR